MRTDRTGPSAASVRSILPWPNRAAPSVWSAVSCRSVPRRHRYALESLTCTMETDRLDRSAAVRVVAIPATKGSRSLRARIRCDEEGVVVSLPGAPHVGERPGQRAPGGSQGPVLDRVCRAGWWLGSPGLTSSLPPHSVGAISPGGGGRRAPSPGACPRQYRSARTPPPCEHDHRGPRRPDGP